METEKIVTFKAGDKIPTINGDSIEIKSFLDSGTQGEVYKVLWNEKEFALKWYNKKPRTPKKETLYDRLYENFKHNIDRGSPAPTFLWPLALTKRDSFGRFGYIMDLRPNEFKELSKFNLDSVRFLSANDVLNAMLNLCLSFKLLHSNGLSYQDLNDGNFFFNPNDGDLRICDTDNVVASGDTFDIIGTLEFMAPEVMAKNSSPNSESDRFSLAIILFMLMCKSHPLVGKKNDAKIPAEENMNKLYRDNPIFIFDPNDSSNRPNPKISPSVEIFWNFYPDCLKKLFIKVFDKSLMNKNGTNFTKRVIEVEWVKAIFQAKHNLISCPYCNKEIFIDLEKKSTKCFYCKKDIERPIVIKLSDYTIPLIYKENDFKFITEFEITRNQPTFENIKKKFAIYAHPKGHPNIEALVNFSNRKWKKTKLDGSVGEIPITTDANNIGAAAILRDGKLDCSKINFGYSQEDYPVEK